MCRSTLFTEAVGCEHPCLPSLAPGPDGEVRPASARTLPRLHTSPGPAEEYPAGGPASGWAGPWAALSGPAGVP